MLCGGRVSVKDVGATVSGFLTADQPELHFYVFAFWAEKNAGEET